MSAVGSDYARGGSGPDLQGDSIHLASAEERSCWPAANRVLLTGTGSQIQAMAAGGSVTPRGLKVQTKASVRSLSMLAVESAPVGYVGELRACPCYTSILHHWSDVERVEDKCFP